MPENQKPDLAKFLADPAFQGDRDLMFGVIDARLKHHAEEAQRRAEENKPKNIFDVLFGGVK
jgi:hypothetical protein